ncbi:MAG: prephenate dehydrogenase [Saccharofermentanales bacterium]
MDNIDFSKMKIGIIGLGLIGGSIARALTRKVGVGSIMAVDLDEASLKKALSDGNITSYVFQTSDLKECDIIYLCVPVSCIYPLIDELSVWFKGIVTDISSTKHGIVSYVAGHYPGMRFIGGHPMAGSEKVGYAASNENLFENAPYILCAVKPENDCPDDSYYNDFRVVRDLAARMSAIPIEMDSKEHDEAVGLISHLPHIVAYSLVNAVRAKGDERLRLIAAGGFRDITRIASSDPEIWTDILCNSGDTIAELLDDYIGMLNETKEALQKQDRKKLYELFSQAKIYRDQLPVASNSNNQPVQLWVEVDDKPGMIGQIAVLFGDKGINIKNMNIQNNRAYEGGSLRITLSSLTDARLGLDLLEKENLVVRIVE